MVTSGLPEHCTYAQEALTFSHIDEEQNLASLLDEILIPSFWAVSFFQRRMKDSKEHGNKEGVWRENEGMSEGKGMVEVRKERQPKYCKEYV